MDIKKITLFCVLLVVLYGGCGIGMAFMAMNLGGTVLQVIYRITSNSTVETDIITSIAARPSDNVCREH